MRTAVVILNWNSASYLERFLPGILASVGYLPDGSPREGTMPKDEVIVADNSSSDSSVKVLEDRFSHVKRILLEQNYGFTGGYNRALLPLEGYEYFLLLNSDIEVEDSFLEPMAEWMDTHPECGACSIKLHSFQRRDYFEYAGAAGGMIDRYGFPFCRGRVMQKVEKDTGQYDQGTKDVLWATGACLMVRASLYKQLGGLDDRFFAHMEEIDLCWRMQLEGWRVSVVPSGGVYHLGGGTLAPDSPFKLRLNYRNNLLLLENNLPFTFALEYLKKGLEDERKISGRCIRRTRRRLFTRKILDGVSAIMYLLGGKKEYFSSVWQAHRQYRELSCEQSREKIESYVRGRLERKRQGEALPSVRGLYRGWMVPWGLAGSETFFRRIHSM